MTNKSYVTMEAKACIICCKPVETNAILLDRRLQERFEHTTVTGFGPPCPDCVENITRPHSDGSPGDRIALVAIDPDRSASGGYAMHPSENIVNPAEAYRTGKISFLERWMWPSCFSIPVPKGALVFLEGPAITLVEARVDQVCRFHNARQEYRASQPDDEYLEGKLKQFAEDYQDDNSINAKGKESEDGEDPVGGGSANTYDEVE